MVFTIEVMVFTDLLHLMEIRALAARQMTANLMFSANFTKNRQFPAIFAVTVNVEVLSNLSFNFRHVCFSKFLK